MVWRCCCFEHSHAPLFLQTERSLVLDSTETRRMYYVGTIKEPNNAQVIVSASSFLCIVDAEIYVCPGGMRWSIHGTNLKTSSDYKLAIIRFARRWISCASALAALFDFIFSLRQSNSPSPVMTCKSCIDDVPIMDFSRAWPIIAQGICCVLYRRVLCLLANLRSWNRYRCWGAMSCK